MLVHSGITPGSYIKAFNSTKNYPSAILHLIRPMTKLCLSDLFSISLAEFYSSDKLKLSFTLILSLLTIPSFSVSTCSFENWSSLSSCIRTKQSNIGTKACKIVNEKIKMAEILKEVSLLILLAVAAAALSHSCQVTLPPSQCPHPQMEDMDG